MSRAGVFSNASSGLGSSLCNESCDSSNDDDSIVVIIRNDSSSESPKVYNFYKTHQLMFLCVLFVFIVVSNVLIIAAILCSNGRKSRMDFFILHLAIADLSMGLIVVLSDIIWKSTIEWHGGKAGCKIVRYFQSVATFASTYVLVSLSIDRVKAIVRPLASNSGRSRRLLIFGAWAAASLFSIPMLILPQEVMKQNIRQCQIVFPEPWYWKPYIFVLTVLLFIAPAIVIAICYMIIVVVVWRKSSMTTGAVATKTTVARPSVIKRRRGGALLQYSMHRGHAADARFERCLETRSSSRGVIPKAKIKTIKMTFVIVIAFVMCWSPFIVFNLLDIYGLVRKTQTNSAIAIFIQSLVPLNSAANPIIFCLFSTKECKTRRLKYVRRSRFWNYCFPCLLRLRASSSSSTASGFRNGGGGGDANPRSTGYPLTTFTGAAAAAAAATGVDPDDSATTTTTTTTRVTRRLRVAAVGVTGRRHSSTPYVKGSLNVIENEILLKHVRRRRLEDEDDQDSEDDEEATTESG